MTPSGEPDATTTWVVAQSMARIAARRPSCEVSVMARPPGTGAGPGRRPPGAGSSAARRRTRRSGRPAAAPAGRRPSRSGHSTSVTPADWRSSMRPAGERIGAIGEAIQVGMEERQAPLVLGHEDERGRGDGRVDAEPAPDGLGEMGLAGPELAPQAEEVAGLGHRAERLAEPRRRLGIRGDQGPLAVHGRRHHANRSRSPIGTVATDPSSSRMRPASRCTSPSNRRSPTAPSQRPSRPSRAPPRTRTRSGRRDRQRRDRPHRRRARAGRR